MASAVRTARPVKPAELKNYCLIERPFYPCDLLPKGLPGVVQFNGATYTVMPLGEDSGCGFRMENINSGAVYDIDTSSGAPYCDCADSTYRERACKHVLALRRMRNERAI